MANYTSTFTGQQVELGLTHLITNGAGTAGAWTAAINGVTELKAGFKLDYKVNVAGGASGTTLTLSNNAGTNLGTKAIKVNGEALKDNVTVGSVLHLIYDGTDFLALASGNKAKVENSMLIL